MSLGKSRPKRGLRIIKKTFCGEIRMFDRVGVRSQIINTGGREQGGLKDANIPAR